MPVLIGFFVGEFLKGVGFFRALGALLLLAGASFVTYRLVERNLDPAMATSAAVLVPLALFVWAIWRPLGGLRLWIIDGVYLAARFGMWLGLVLFGLILVQVGFHLRLWIERAWTWAALTAVLWGVQWLLDAQVRRVRRMAEPSNDREVLT